VALCALVVAGVGVVALTLIIAAGTHRL